MYLPISPHIFEEKTGRPISSLASSPHVFFSIHQIPGPDSSFTQPSRCVLSHRVATDGLNLRREFHQDADRLPGESGTQLFGRNIL